MANVNDSGRCVFVNELYTTFHASYHDVKKDVKNFVDLDFF